MSAPVQESREARRVAEKVAKLLALAEDQAGTPEGANAAAAARRLMEAHTLSAADIADVGDPLERREVSLSRDRWKRDLLSEVSNYCGCKALFIVSAGIGCIFGRSSAVKVAEYLFDYLQAEVGRRARAHLDRQLATDKGGRVRIGRDLFTVGTAGWSRTARTMFCNGAMAAVVVRLRAMQATEESGATAEHALVLARSNEADSFAVGWCKARGSTIKTTGEDKSRKYGAAGLQAGRDIPINPAMDVRPVPEARRLQHA